MAFALRRAALSDGACRRIIVVIPYLSIIDQNAEVYSRVFGPDAILEHHSGSFDRLRQGADNEHFIPASPEKEDSGYSPGALRPATENWDAPLIVTTSVRFFESLFSNRPSDLRRVHNIARSIVILDEVQTLPRRLLAPLLKMIGELSEHWGCTFVFSTATQPAFEKPAEAARKDAGRPAKSARSSRNRRNCKLR
jgi:CRISPR-associated endonuclease/helicase Cas3